MRISMMQPVFMPWQGLFELIIKCDIFIFLDDFQFSYQSFDQRNKFFVNKGQVDWYTVPVHKALSFKSQYNFVKPNYDIPWPDKIWKRIQNNYSKASFFDEFAEPIKKWLYTEWESLSSLNISFIKLVCDSFKITLPEFRLSSQCSKVSDLKRSERVFGLLRWCGADSYLSAHGSFRYMYEDGVFPVKDIELLFQDFQPRPYQQIGSTDKFIPYLSAIDALMNIGPNSTLNLIMTGTERWLTWDDMVNKSK